MSFDEPATIVQPGRLRAKQFGEYLVIERLGQGGMGTVDLAVHAPEGGIERTVALKRLRVDLCQDARFSQMFEDEVRIASRLIHPHVARLLHAGQHRGYWFYSMDLLLGAPLSLVIKHLQTGSNAALLERWPAIVVKLVTDACEGLHAAHELRNEAGLHLGVVHRDVSPDNLFVGFDGGVRVIDFGIASAHDRLVRTQTGNVRGKLGYVAPERFTMDHPTDRRVDVWSLGVTLWEALTMAPLFRRNEPLEILKAVRSGVIPPISDYRGGVPESIERVIRKALTLEPDQRYLTARAMGKDLQAASHQAGWAVDLPQIEEWMNELLPDAARRQERLAQIASKARKDTVELEAPDDDLDAIESLMTMPAARAAPSVSPPAPVDRFQPEPISSWNDDDVATRKRPRTVPRLRIGPSWWMVVAAAGMGALLGAIIWLVF